MQSLPTGHEYDEYQNAQALPLHWTLSSCEMPPQRARSAAAARGGSHPPQRPATNEYGSLEQHPQGYRLQPPYQHMTLHQTVGPGPQSLDHEHPGDTSGPGNERPKLRSRRSREVTGQTTVQENPAIHYSDQNSLSQPPVTTLAFDRQGVQPFPPREVPADPMATF